ncbi:hypothetical protein N7523_003644 [Penicillium sp. IBT 18751x]|nr:hypothetical protein N7523_003644 [Penicillium sp. IBT 18751x]
MWLTVRSQEFRGKGGSDSRGMFVSKDRDMQSMLQDAGSRGEGEENREECDCGYGMRQIGKILEDHDRD